ncbi:PREDICTED: exocyst complex component SEC8-like isoform X2 [Nelumbo nucifera]|uniref:Exocyst complex component Sec8 n=1 Tax=Nelumbo nucifera TaxID=4432 RepID=A0A1U7ZDA8_NELNU|nr:PREDICTED: exocyst complex component SEC8-like isoform X2 [Nelumbo nucifera]
MDCLLRPRKLDREGEVRYLKEQNDIIEEVVDEVVHAYHSGFNQAIQNYSQILRLFSESAESIGTLKVDLAEAKKFLSSRNKQLHQLWYRSVTLRHIISVLDQIESIAKVPARIEKLIADKQLYAAVQLHVQSTLMLEREGLQAVGALQDVCSELTKLQGVLFYKALEDLHCHLYNKGEYSLSFDGHDDDNAFEILDGAALDGIASTRVGGGNVKDIKSVSHQIPIWLSCSTPNEFIEAIKKSDAALHVKYMYTMVECLSMLEKIAATGDIICKRLRPTIRDIITSKIKAHALTISSSSSGVSHSAGTVNSGLHYLKEQLESYPLQKQKHQNGTLEAAKLLAVSPVSPAMAPTGAAQAAAKELLDSILDIIIRILENHVIVGELLESKSAQHSDTTTQDSLTGDMNWNPDSETSQITGGYSVGSSLTVLQSECQQLICEILRATPEAASADASAQTARLANKVPSKDKRNCSEDGLTFAFRFTEATISIPNKGVDLIHQGWNRKGANVLQEGYGTATVLPEQGIYLAASIYRPVIQFTDKIASLLPPKHSQLGNDGLLSFVENFLKDRFLPTLFVDYRKGVQQAISCPAAFRPRANAASIYAPLVEKGRPVLQGLLAIDFLAKEVLDWTQAMPKYTGELVKYVQTFLERTYERCRTSYMEAVLEKLSYMLIGRLDVENLMRLDPASAYLPNSFAQPDEESSASNAETVEAEAGISDLLWALRPIKQENLIHDDNKLILLASLSDSLEYVADSIERLGQTSLISSMQVDEAHRHTRTSSIPPRDLESFAEEYRKLAIDCLKVLHVEMQLETIFHMQEMMTRDYLDDQDAEEPDDFVISLNAQITRRDEEMAPFVAKVRRKYIFGGICSVAAHASIKALVEMKSINLFGVQQICRNSIALEQALAAIPSIDSEAIQQRLDRVRTYYELLNLPFEALLAFITDHKYLFTAAEYSSLLKVKVPGREIPVDAGERVSEILSH